MVEKRVAEDAKPQVAGLEPCRLITPGDGRAGNLRSAPHEVLSDLVRLRITCLLDTTEWRRFTALCELAGISQDRLKRHFYLLRSRGYVTTTRLARESTSWALLTSYGETERTAYLHMLAALPVEIERHTTELRTKQPNWFCKVGAM
ncbi:transcriptional regulator [Amycolatopsis sp. H20-H5]|uniref:transcriptional regulator n=1 Tax=Amycolatopsis sp. H20-H5 TaxID=3046309 RepID=UPI002DBBB1BD|nr:transcriptional regulator [Amycolatopsis sp. H20-H5]MEC3974884.1 transcriptional regulator [Amycolatopsis sp. H20-H5]